ncbi:MBOAT family O-acyltransferase [Siccirubricoccus deserti]|uniref:Probable alginate O-acetylase AlgI n=1 Tax=Siccirubricoccus deserti TaxID=2013562 RepID=A0A9X0UFF1_9PROT|nr:MBOAT family protein [Siccirubricoccus deserti]MBC4018687.1 MBOAT family protein [Siccirubricoccus deserti]
MLFSSATFIIGFLPIVLLGFFVLAGSNRQRLAAAWLTAASLVFYGWWNPSYVPLLMVSIVANYLLGGYLLRKPSRAALTIGIAANLALLVYYKYTTFILMNADAALGLDWQVQQIVLPLAISFFTFQQIAYLSDAQDGAVVEHDFLNYCLFITFFPHLIAGPITHHREMMQQFGNPDNFKPRFDNISVGATLFVLGLTKKVVFADPLGARASPAFAAAAEGAALPFLDAWGAALSYTLQIYFDFSGYTDMAIGLGLLFGISLPPNFDSPYKARNVIEFWSRWHMTLTRFLTAYIYNPIVLRVTRARAAAGKPLPRRGRMTLGSFLTLVAYPTLLTMFISGVWHGAGWQFVVFGLLHGFYLVVAHAWRALKVQRGWKLDDDRPLPNAAAVLLTFLCVVVAMVFFRASDLTTALNLLAGMAGLHGIVVPTALAQLPLFSDLTEWYGLQVGPGSFFRILDWATIMALLAVVWVMPNTQQWLRHYRTALGWRARPNWLQPILPAMTWRPTPTYGAVLGLLCFFVLMRTFSSAPTEFLYFQF